MTTAKLRISIREAPAYTLVRIWVPAGKIDITSEEFNFPECKLDKGVVFSGNISTELLCHLVVRYEYCKWLALDKGTKGYTIQYSQDLNYPTGSVIPR